MQSGLLAALLTLCLVVGGLKLWRYDLKIPLNYSGDALFETVLIKALSEGSWNYHIARLGAPFGMDAVDFPIGCTLDFAIVKLLSFLIRNPFLLINVFWLATIAAAGASAALFLRALQIAPRWSVVFGVLYGIVPFVFYRNLAHLNLVHYILPAAGYLGVILARGQTVGSPCETEIASEEERRRPCVRLLGCYALCVALGLSYIYWGFFACIVIFLGALIGWFRAPSKLRHTLTALSFVAVIVISSVADISASLLYWKEQGKGAALDYKFSAEADIFGLKVRQLLDPIPSHPLPPFRHFHEKLRAAHFPNDDNESATASLGLVGTAGFLLLILIGVARPGRGLLSDTRFEILAGFVLGLLLLASVGGFGSLFNAFVFHEFRAYNRVSPLISLFSLAAAAIAVDSWTRNWRAPKAYPLAAGLLLLGVIDQVEPAFLTYRAANETRFLEDHNFIERLETLLPPGAMIFQLPHTGFPPDGKHERMQAYENARAYLHSRSLRWSWGSFDGRHSGWAEATAKLPPDEMLDRLTASGFDGVLVDRFGFPNADLEGMLSSRLGSAPLLDNGRWSFLDLRPQRAHFEQAHSAEENARLRDLALHPPAEEWLGEFSVQELSPDGTFRWCGRTGTIRLLNPAAMDLEITVAATLRQYAGTPASLTIEANGHQQRIPLNDAPMPFQERFFVQAHGSVEIHFTYEGALLNVPEDARKLAFQVQNFSLRSDVD